MDRSTVCRLSHSATVTIGARGTSLVEEEGIEPSFAGCRPAVLPLNDSPKTWLRAGELNATRVAYEASMTPVHLPAFKLGQLNHLSFPVMEPRARFELAFPDYRSGASPSMLTGLVIQEPMERIERSSVAYHATALPTELHRLEPEGVIETPASALRVRRSST